MPANVNIVKLQKFTPTSRKLIEHTAQELFQGLLASNPEIEEKVINQQNQAMPLTGIKLGFDNDHLKCNKCHRKSQYYYCSIDESNGASPELLFCEDDFATCCGLIDKDPEKTRQNINNWHFYRDEYIHFVMYQSVVLRKKLSRQKELYYFLNAHSDLTQLDFIAQLGKKVKKQELFSDNEQEKAKKIHAEFIRKKQIKVQQADALERQTRLINIINKAGLIEEYSSLRFSETVDSLKLGTPVSPIAEKALKEIISDHIDKIIKPAPKYQLSYTRPSLSSIYDQIDSNRSLVPIFLDQQYPNYYDIDKALSPVMCTLKNDKAVFKKVYKLVMDASSEIKELNPFWLYLPVKYLIIFQMFNYGRGIDFRAYLKPPIKTIECCTDMCSMSRNKAPYKTAYNKTARDLFEKTKKQNPAYLNVSQLFSIVVPKVYRDFIEAGLITQNEDLQYVSLLGQ